MAFSTSTASEILKIDYRGPVRELLNQANYFYSKVLKTKKRFRGKTAYFPLHTGRNVSFRSSTEGGAFPTAGQQGYNHAEYYPRQLVMAIELTGLAMAASEGDAASFVSALDSEMKGAMKDARSNMNRMVFHDGSSILTVCGTTSASTTVVVSSTKYIKPGMIVNIVTTSTGAPITDGTAVEVQTVPSATTFTVLNAVTTSSSHSVLLTGSRTAGADWGKHQDTWGLEALIASANPTGGSISDLVGDVTRTGNTFWQPNVVAGSSLDASTIILKMQEAFDASDLALDKAPGLILTSHGAKRTYGSALTPDKRYPAGGEITLDGGYKALDFNGIPVLADKDCNLTQTPGAAFGRMYFLRMDAFEVAMLKDWDWVDDDGAILKLKPTTGTYQDAYLAFLRSYQELCLHEPPANTLLTGITES